LIVDNDWSDVNDVLFYKTIVWKYWQGQFSTIRMTMKIEKKQG